MKSRCDAWYAEVSVELQETLLSEVRTMAWQDAVSHISEKLRVKPPSKSAYYRWQQRIAKKPDPTCSGCSDRDKEIQEQKKHIRALLNTLSDVHIMPRQSMRGGQWKDGKYYPSKEESAAWVAAHQEQILAFGKIRVSKLVKTALKNPLGFCYSAHVTQGHEGRERKSIILCIAVTNEKNKDLVEKYKRDNPTEASRLSDLGNLMYMDMLIPAIENKKLITLKLDDPDAVVLCASDPVSVEYIEREFNLYIEAIEKKNVVIGKYTPPPK